METYQLTPVFHQLMTLLVPTDPCLSPINDIVHYQLTPCVSSINDTVHYQLTLVFHQFMTLSTTNWPLCFTNEWHFPLPTDPCVSRMNDTFPLPTAPRKYLTVVFKNTKQKMTSAFCKPKKKYRLTPLWYSNIAWIVCPLVLQTQVAKEEISSGTDESSKLQLNQYNMEWQRQSVEVILVQKLHNVARWG